MNNQESQTMRLAEYAVACDKEGDTIRGLVWAYLAFRSDRASADVSVIIEGVRDMVGADIPLTSTRQALTDLCRKGMLEGGPDGRGPFLISKKGLDGLKNATSEYEELRGRSFAAWAISEAARLGNPTLVKPLENAADEYIKAAVATLGTSAAASFTGSDDSDGTLYEVLEDVIATHLPRLDPAEARISFSSLMDLGGEEMSAYVGILFEHTIKLLIFRAPNAVRKAIGTSMPRTHLLVDVNVMLAFAGLNKEGEEYPFALRLLALLRRHQGKVVAYVHQESIREWERVIRGARNGLLDGGSSYSSQTSKTILETCNVEGIELAFHRTNAMKFIRPDDFFMRYESGISVCEELNLRHYREDPSSLRAGVSKIQALESAYMEWQSGSMEEYKQKERVKVRHDMVLLDLVHRQDRKEGLPRLPAWHVLTLDRKLSIFERWESDVIGRRSLCRSPSQVYAFLSSVLGDFSGIDNAVLEALTAPALFVASRGDDYTLVKRVHRLVEHLRGDGMSEESVQNLLKDQVLLSRMAAANGDAREEAEAIGIAMASLDERRATRIEELETEILEQKKARQIDKLKIAGLEVRLVEQQSEASKWKGLTILAQEQHNESADKTDEMPHGLVKDATRRPSSNLRVLAVNFVLPTLAIIVAAWIASLAEVFGARLFVYAIVVLAPIGGWVLWPRQKWWIIGVSAFILIIFAGLTVLGRGNLG